ncbi:MAG: hypothetical protein JXQ71_12505 [Verrucomicrobia bacterium]|nr:hypothetical protein [Verrucomicrobiota bacterium]
MIRLRRDCLVFESGGDAKPVPAQHITLELVGAAAQQLDETTLRNVAQGVLYYFKEELGQETVTAKEFAGALEKALHGLGFETQTTALHDEPPRVAEADLCGLADDPGGALELAFFSRLRMELRRQLARSPRLLRFRGLRRCVKQLTGARRWSARCQGLNDQIVDYLRTCLSAEPARDACAMVVE